MKETKNRHHTSLTWVDAVSYMQGGGIFAYPTDTLWGLGCRADWLDLSMQTLALKGESRKPVASVVTTPEDLESLVEVPKGWHTILPGPFTLVLPLKEPSLKHLASDDLYLGCRIPDYPKLINLVRAAGVPLITTSLNLTGQAPATCLEEARKVAEFFQVGLIEEETHMLGASTVIKWNKTSWQILRQGLGIVPKQLLAS
ncbi:MAG: hypothetical protein CSA81_09060 [Acidobacteria bacterium]|nr:MAG: hypothetical protein CSA81_09060 [Acidobacteriota bacterium]PIE91289.1 MAG: hypothetical protein CR997_01740 [Acidobacteriota bacterium]